MTTYVHRCMIVPAHRQAFAQMLCEALAGPAGAGMFVVGLSPGGMAPATHYISIGPVEVEFAALLDDAALLAQACASAGLSITLDECRALLDDADVSADESGPALARLGLELTK